jgi:hypothetical protein
MFGGGGFIGQMHQTNKENRALLKDEKRKPFMKQEFRDRSPRIVITSVDEFTAEEKQDIHEKLREQRKRELTRKLMIFLFSLLMTGILYIVFEIYWKQPLIEFMD